MGINENYHSHSISLMLVWLISFWFQLRSDVSESQIAYFFSTRVKLPQRRITLYRCDSLGFSMALTPCLHIYVVHRYFDARVHGMKTSMSYIQIVGNWSAISIPKHLDWDKINKFFIIIIYNHTPMHTVLNTPKKAKFIQLAQTFMAM